jgi:hypothetical protein
MKPKNPGDVKLAFLSPLLLGGFTRGHSVNIISQDKASERSVIYVLDTIAKTNRRNTKSARFYTKYAHRFLHFGGKRRKYEIPG